MRRVRPATATSLLAALVAVGLSATLVTSAVADPEDRKREVDAAVGSLQEDLVGTSAELQAAYAALAASQAQLPIAQAALEQAQAAQAEAERRDAELASRLAAAEQSQANAEAALVVDEQEIGATEGSIGRLAAQSYRSQGVSPGLTAIIASADPQEFADRYMLVSSVQRQQNTVLYRLEAEQATQTNAEARLEAVEAQVADLRRQAADNLVVAQQARQAAADQRAEVDRIVAEQTAASQAIAARQAEEQAQLVALEAEQAALAAELARLAEEAKRAEAARLAAEAAAAAARRSSGGPAPAPAAPPAASGGVLLRPVGGRVSSEYGYRIHPISGVRRLHAGIDLAPGCNVPIVAAEAGTIVSAGWAGGYGNRIVINHGVLNGEGVATSYNHMSGYEVRSGRVERGQVIGYVGTTGASTGCHLHWEVYVNGATVNPRGWM